MDPDQIEALRATWSSYDGHLAHCASFRLRERLWNRFRKARALVRWDRGRIGRRFALCGASPSLRAQFRQLRQGCRSSLLMVKVGRFGELCFADGDAWGLSFRRPGAGRRVSVGLPWRRVSGRVNHVLGQGRSVMVALEADYGAGAVRHRHLAYWIAPVGRNFLARTRERSVPPAARRASRRPPEQLSLPGFEGLACRQKTVFGRACSRKSSRQRPGKRRA